MINVLSVINNEFYSLDIPYAYESWECDVELPKFIGELLETPTGNEDGKSEYSFILTGYGTSYSQLYNFAEQLKQRYKSSLIIDGVVITYQSMITIPNDSEDLKQIQINFIIKEWSVF